MIRVSIYGSSSNDRRKLKEKIMNCCEQNVIRYSITEFTTKAELVEGIGKLVRPDIIFVDVDCEGNSNSQEIKRIYSLIYGRVKHIVYTTSTMDCVMDLFKVRPYDVLIKPTKMEDIERILIEIRNKLNESIKYFYYKAGKVFAKEALDDILYFKSNNRIITIFKRDSRIDFYGRMSSIYERTDGRLFWDIHRSYLVNKEHIVKLKDTRVYLDNGEYLPTSRNRMKRILLLHRDNTNKSINLDKGLRG